MHLLCPHCHGPIELVDLQAREIVCPSCGSSFQIERSSTTDWRPRDGERKFGKFELLQQVGVGAFGTVYKARDPQLDRVVAIKIPRAGNLAGQEDFDRFLREARSIAQLRHPGIIPIHEAGQTDGTPYLVSEFVEGVTLSDLLTTRLPTFPESVQLTAAVADALQYAHNHGVVHRDVKPSNIILSEDNKPRLMDFGLAKRDAGEITITVDGQVLGTPAYMSPEQARGEAHKVDGRSDVYSLGVILYRLLTGELPFRGNTRMLLHQVLHDEPKPPRRLNDRIPRDLETVCLKCLEKESPKRYGSAELLGADLYHWLRGEPILARPIGRSERLWRWCRRNPVVAGLSSGLTIALVTGTGISVAFAFREQKERQRAEKAESVAVGAQDDLELALARSLVRPLNPENDPRGDALSKPEADALWELVEKPGDRFWWLFVQDATSGLLAARQLGARAEPVLVAAVGLNSERRDRVEQLLAERLQSPELGARHQFGLIQAALSLGDLQSPNQLRISDLLLQMLSNRDVGANQVATQVVELTSQMEAATGARIAGQAADMLTRLLEKENDPSARSAVATGLAAVAVRMETVESGRPTGEAVDVLTRALQNETNADARWMLARGVAAVARQMETAGDARAAARAADGLNRTLERETNDIVRRELAETLATVVRRLEGAEYPAVLARSLAVLTLVMENETNPSNRSSLVEGLTAVALRMEPALASGVLTRALEEENDGFARRNLAQGLAVVVGRMEAARGGGIAGQAADLLTRALDKEPNAYARKNLAEGLAAVVARMDAAEAARIARRAAGALTRALEKETNGDARDNLAEALAAVALRMDAAEAASVLGQTLKSETNAGAFLKLADGLAIVAGRMETAGGARVAGPAAGVLTRAMKKEPDAVTRRTLAQALAAVAGQMEASDAAVLLTGALEEEKDAGARQNLAIGLGAVAGRLDPTHAASLLTRAAKALTVALEKEKDTFSRATLAEGLAAITTRMDPAEATKTCLPLIQELVLTGETAKTEGEEGRTILRTGVSLIRAFAPETATIYSTKLACSLCSGDMGLKATHGTYAESIDPLLTDSNRVVIRSRTVASATAIGLALPAPLGALAPLVEESKPLPCRLATQDLVDLLKMPTVFGADRKVILAHLGNRYGRSFRNHWEFVRYAKENGLDLDFTTPPKRRVQS
jgi:serine/threonine protein kinase